MPELDLPDFNAIPGWVEIDIQPYKEGDPNYTFLVPDGGGKRLPLGCRLADLLKKHGDKMTVTDPFRMEEHEVSLVKFAAYDADSTFLVFTYMFRPDPSYVDAHPELSRRP